MLVASSTSADIVYSCTMYVYKRRDDRHKGWINSTGGLHKSSLGWVPLQICTWNNYVKDNYASRVFINQKFQVDFASENSMTFWLKNCILSIQMCPTFFFAEIVIIEKNFFSFKSSTQ